VGNALSLPFEDDSFDAVCTSPTYGNRLAENHDAYDPQARRSYKHDQRDPDWEVLSVRFLRSLCLKGARGNLHFCSSRKTLG